MLLLQDPYLFLKRPPLSSANLLTLEGPGGCGTAGSGGGMVYVQNVQPDGPVTWLFNRATEVPLRWVQGEYC